MVASDSAISWSLGPASKSSRNAWALATEASAEARSYASVAETKASRLASCKVKFCCARANCRTRSFVSSCTNASPALTADPSRTKTSASLAQEGLPIEWQRSQLRLRPLAVALAARSPMKAATISPVFAGIASLRLAARREIKNPPTTMIAITTPTMVQVARFTLVYSFSQLSPA